MKSIFIYLKNLFKLKKKMEQPKLKYINHRFIEKDSFILLNIKKRRRPIYKKSYRNKNISYKDILLKKKEN